jgi:hypothetical protein
LARIIKVPEARPAHPRPAMVLPVISAVEFGAVAQAAEPISKMRIGDRGVAPLQGKDCVYFSEHQLETTHLR